MFNNALQSVPSGNPSVNGIHGWISICGVECVCVYNFNTQWERRRQEMIDDRSKMDKRVFGELGDGITMMKTASGLTPCLVKSMMLETIRAKFKIIVQHGHEVPLVHRAIINKQNSIEISESSQDSERAESVMPMLANFEEEKWSLEK